MSQLSSFEAARLGADRSMATRWRAGSLAPMMALATALLAGCSGDSLPSMPKLSELDPFSKKEAPLPGTRIAITPAADKVAGTLALADRPIIIPPPHGSDTWAQPGGEANNAPGHLSLGATLKQVWSGDAGDGSSKRAKVTASPIVADGRVYTLDAAASVRAFSAGNGTQVWRAKLVPDKRNGEDGFGGGIAYDGGKLYVATGFGQVTALDPASGKVLWQKSVGAPVRSSPTAVTDRVYLVSTDGRFFCLSGADGSELWSYRGVPEKTSIISNPSPAVDGDLAIAPFPSGEVVAIRVASGQVAWTENLSRTQLASGLTSMTDAARPAVDGGVVFSVGHGGRMIAVQSKTGERIWANNVAGTQMPWVAGETLYVVNTGGQLLAVTKRDGTIAWTVKLPGATTWSGPTLAGGMLWLTSNTGQLVGVEALTGKVVSTVSIGQPSYIAPVVAGGRLYVLTDGARLIAYSGG